MSKFKSVIFSVVVIFLTACSSPRSFRLVKAEQEQKQELPNKKVQSTIETDQQNRQAFIAQQVQQNDPPFSSLTNVQGVKRLVVEKKMNVVQSIKMTESKLKQLVAHKKIQPSDNFWLDLIKDFFLFMLVGMIIIGIIAAMIVYGSPTVQLIGKVIAITIIAIALLAFLFS